jgi:hypothetical protein
MNFLENVYIEQSQLQGSLMDEQNTCGINPLFAFGYDSNSKFAGAQILHTLPLNNRHRALI